ncbi:MAG TPA: glycosyltransferase [Bacillota bacterium]|nr:glycosyltransferase [Bacillota bacterium]
MAQTVAAIRPLVDEVCVVDDASSDATFARAAEAGARVRRLPRHGGKTAAVMAGLADTAAPLLLLLDADLGATGAEAQGLLAEVEWGRADMAIAVLPPSGRAGGRGHAVGLARAGIRRLAGISPLAPLSGQRAVLRKALHAFRGARGFGLEVALTIDLVRAGYRVVEVPVAMAHRVGGLGVRDSLHRAHQMADVAWALAQRLR